MSAIAGALHFAPAPGAAQGLDAMLQALRARAPHGMAACVRSPIALGQAWLRTGPSRAEAAGRMTLDGRVWIAADARIDGRADLVHRLRAAGRDAQVDDPASELILHAYLAFGDAFLDHLIGDFAFALWDEAARKLVCARDRFGVRPFYLARLPGRLVFATDIAALLADPEVPRDLDDDSVADFLLVGVPASPAQTIYRHVRCLPPAACLQVNAGCTHQGLYWRLQAPDDAPLLRREDYVQRFRDLFTQAVTDRLPTGPVATQLSGGMDSGSIAAVAASRPGRGPLIAHHVSIRSLEPGDEEGDFAREVAQALGIPLIEQDLGGYRPFERSGELRTSFPLAYPLFAAHHDALQAVLSHGAHVLLSGYLGDSVLAPEPDHPLGLLRRRHWRRFARETLHHLQSTRSLRGLGLRTLVRPQGPPHWKPTLPDWFEPGYARARDLEGRWEAWWWQHEHSAGAWAQLRTPWLHRTFETNAALAVPVEMRYPFCDLRLVEFALTLPNFMRTGKVVLREAMSGIVPEPVRLRPKTGAAGDLLRAMVASGKFEPERDAGPSIQGLSRDAFIRAWDRYRAGAGSDSTWTSWLLFQPLALSRWLAQKELVENE